MRAPAEPARPGKFRAPTARMVGVARRNADRATSWWSSRRHRPPTMHTPERLILPGRAAIWSSPRRPLPVGQGGDAGVGVPGGGEVEGDPTTRGLGFGRTCSSTDGRDRFFAVVGLTQADRHTDGPAGARLRRAGAPAGDVLG